jgi:hypothetical protein
MIILLIGLSHMIASNENGIDKISMSVVIALCLKKDFTYIDFYARS